MNNENLNETIFEEGSQPTKKIFDLKKIIPIIIAIVVIFTIIQSCGGSETSGGLFNVGVSDEMYIGCAKEIISKSLKKPSSLEVIDAYIYEKDDYGSAIVCMDITSENGFGGADRDTVYVCVMYLESDGNYKFNPTFNYTENVTNLDILKSINGFGEPKE